MSREPMTRKLDSDELLRFLDDVAAESTQSQRLPVSLPERAPAVRRSEPHRPRPATHSTSPGEPLTTRCRAVELADGGLRAATPGKLAHQRPRLPLPVLELTMLDAGWVAAERRSKHGRCRALLPWPRGRRLLTAGVAGASLLLLLLACALRVRQGAPAHAAVEGPPPLPDARLAPRVSEPDAVGHETGSAQPRAEPHQREAHDDVTSAAGPGGRELAVAAPRDAVTPTIPSQRAPDGLDHLATQSVRAAVDLLLSGHNRAALDAYRGLALASGAPPVLSELVRLLEREQQICEQRGSPCGL